MSARLKWLRGKPTLQLLQSQRHKWLRGKPTLQLLQSQRSLGFLLGYFSPPPPPQQTQSCYQVKPILYFFTGTSQLLTFPKNAGTHPRSCCCCRVKQALHFFLVVSPAPPPQSHGTHTHMQAGTPGVTLTFEKLRIANAQHGKKCVSSPAAKATISTDLPKIDKHENTNV